MNSGRVGSHQVRLGWVVIVTGRVWCGKFFYCLQSRFGYATRLTRKQTVGVYRYRPALGVPPQIDTQQAVAACCASS